LPQGWVTKKIWSPPFATIEIFLVTLSLWGLKFFDCHQIVVVFWMKAKFFQLPSNTLHHWMVTKNDQLLKGVWACAMILEKQPLLSLLSDRKTSVAFQWWGHVGW
jgi:hypothetical protein